MGNRRKARENSLQLLYEIDLSEKDFERVLNDFCEGTFHSEGDSLSTQSPQDEVREFTRQIVEGVCHNVGEIDQIIEGHSTHWKINRMASVDRNILRMAVFELLYCPDIPPSVTINEAIEIAKRFGTEESGSFVNGVLDHIAKDIKKV